MMFQQMEAAIWFKRVLLKSEPNLSNQMMEYASGVTNIRLTNDADKASAIDQSASYIPDGKNVLLVELTFKVLDILLLSVQSFFR